MRLASTLGAAAARWRAAAATPRPQRPLLTAADAAALIALARSQRLPQPAQALTQRVAGDSPARWLGRGLDYAESRAYQPGDDLRDLHWRLFARTGRPYVQLHQQHSAPTLHLLLDLRPGMAFGTRVRTKAEQAARVTLLGAAVHLLAAEGAACALQLSLWRDAVQSIDLGRGLPAVRGLAQRLERERLTAPTAEAEADAAASAMAHFAAWAQRLGRTLPDGARVLLASDAAGWDDPAADAALWALRRRASLVLLHVTDGVETALPEAPQLQAAPFVDLAQHRAGVLPDAAARAAFATLAARADAARQTRWRARGLGRIAADAQQDDVVLLRALRGVAA